MSSDTDDTEALVKLTTDPESTDDDTGTVEADGNAGLSKYKIENARRFLYDEDEPMGGQASMLNLTSIPIANASVRGCGGGGSSAFPPRRSNTNLSASHSIYNTNSDNSTFSSKNNRRGLYTLSDALMSIILTYRKRVLRITIFVGVMLVGVWGFAAMFGGNDNDNREQSNTNDGTYVRGGEGQNRVDEFKHKIVTEGLSTKDVIESVGSPQYQAIDWLANVDGAQVKAADIHSMHRYALAVLFYSTTRSEEDHTNELEGNWINQENWLSSKDICSWYGVQCEYDEKEEKHGSSKKGGTRGFVRALELSMNGLDGSLPSELSTLTSLTKLDLSRNGLTGTLPTKICELHDLRDLNLRENNLVGIIPFEYGNKLSALRNFDLGVNRLNGSIPKQLEHMVELRSLGLERNQFKGRIPDLEDMSKLTELYLESNNLDGPFPNSISKLTSLVEINLSNNHITGSLPYELIQLTKLEKLILDHLNLEGTIPSNLFTKVTRLTQLSLQNNAFTGQIPTSIGHLKDMQDFYAGDNNFTGTIPREIGLMADLRQLQIHGNIIGGSIPDIISALNNLEGLQLSRNKITGIIPSEIGNLHRLVAIHFETNQLEGTVPSEIGNMKSLKQARLYYNILTGTVPKEVCTLISDEELAYLGADCSDGTVTCDCCTKCF